MTGHSAAAAQTKELIRCLCAGVGAAGDGQLGAQGPDRGAPPGKAAVDGDAQPPPAHLHREDRQCENARERSQPSAGAAVRPKQVKVQVQEQAQTRPLPWVTH